jgi:NAD(P)-dependent dehydrogenase (short-subunit alcohol dehydrogenase family)
VSPEPTLRVLVAGARGGIGGACAEVLRQAGHQVVGVDRDPGPAGGGSRPPRQDLAPPGHDHRVHAVDVTLPGGAERAVELAGTILGDLDGIVHAVGMSGRRLGDGPVTKVADSAWAQVMRVNLESAFRLMRAGLPALSEGGSFVTVGSVLGRSADRDFLTAAYAASKGALASLTRVAAMELAARGVRVNLVAAGLVDTPMAGRALGDQRISARMPELQPLGGAAVTAAEVAAAVAWLLSPASGRTTGASIPVDGGWTLR